MVTLVHSFIFSPIPFIKCLFVFIIMKIVKKILATLNIIILQVIDEFLCAKDRCPSRLPEWKRPVPAKLQVAFLVYYNYDY